MLSRRFHRGGALVATTMLLLVGCSSGGSGTSSSSGAGSTTTVTAPANKRPNTNGKVDSASDPAAAPAGDPGATYTPTGPLIADNGFRPEKDSFGVENYGNDPFPDGSAPTNLTAVQMRKLFGDGICVDAQSNQCDLTPEAAQWMQVENDAMAGGHCQGFAALSELLFTGQEKATDYGADTAPALAVQTNQTLQSEIAYAWSFQTLDSVNAALVTGTPNDIIAKLKEVLVPNPKSLYVLSLRQPDGSGGHAITPYAVEDTGGGIDKILVYDNNYPKVTRAVTVDTNANTWQYNLSTNPNTPSSLYQGDANTMSMRLRPVNPALGVQPAPFDVKAPGGGSSSALRNGPVHAVTMSDVLAQATPQADNLDMIFLDGSDSGHGHLLITDPQGHRLGFAGGQLLNEIPGASFDQQDATQDWNATQEPDYFVPDGVKYTITLDGSPLKNADQETVGVIAPYYDLAVDNINLQPNEKDVISLAGDGAHYSYTASEAQMPDISLGISDDTADWTFDVSGDDVPANATINVDLPNEGGSMVFGTGAGAPEGSFSIDVSRGDEKGETTFGHSGIQLSGGDTATLQFGNWQNGQQMELDVAANGGTSQPMQLSDQTP